MSRFIKLSSVARSPVERIVFQRLRIRFGIRNVQVHDYRFTMLRTNTATTGSSSLAFSSWWNEGWHVHEIARPGFVHKFQPVTPAETRPAADHVNHSLHFPVMMRAGLNPRLHYNGSCPQLLRTHPGCRDGFGARHAGRLRRICIELSASHDSQAVTPPVWRTL